MIKWIIKLLGRRQTSDPSTRVVNVNSAVELQGDVVNGIEIPVGEFIWIETCIGMADDAQHKHGVFDNPTPGSADMDCSVRVLSVKADYATVVLKRPEVPSGAQAPHGTIFLIPLNFLEQWPGMHAQHLRKKYKRRGMRHEYGQVQVGRPRTR